MCRVLLVRLIVLPLLDWRFGLRRCGVERVGSTRKQDRAPPAAAAAAETDGDVLGAERANRGRDKTDAVLRADMMEIGAQTAAPCAALCCGRRCAVAATSFAELLCFVRANGSRIGRQSMETSARAATRAPGSASAARQEVTAALCAGNIAHSCGRVNAGACNESRRLSGVIDIKRGARSGTDCL